MRPIIVFASGLAAGLAFLVACGEIPGSGADEPLDGLVTRLVEAPCDKEHRHQRPGLPLTTRYFAEIRVDNVAASDVISVVACGREEQGGAGMIGCGSPDVICEGYEPPDDTCRPVEWRYAGDAIVIDCGRLETAATTTGVTFSRVAVRLAVTP